MLIDFLSNQPENIDYKLLSIQHYHYQQYLHYFDIMRWFFKRQEHVTVTSALWTSLSNLQERKKLLQPFNSFRLRYLTLTKVSTAPLATSSKEGRPPKYALWFMDAEVSTKNTIIVMVMDSASRMYQ